MRPKRVDRRVMALAWLVLVVASWLTQQRTAPSARTPEGATRGVADLPAFDAAGPVSGAGPVRVSYLRWGGEGEPVLLLHGSPGRGSDFARLGPRLASRGYRVVAPDLPGFGASSHDLPDYSFAGHARSMRALMEALEIEQAHVVGWSNGGGAAVVLADLAPGRVRSVTLLASIGVQEHEGSGSYWFEHAKYAVGYALLVVLPEAIPHFGLLGPRDERHAFIRNFWDSDQRPLRGLMERLGTPTLILHGGSDFLVPAATAEESRALIRSSRLVMLDATHFLPFLQAERTSAELVGFFRSVADDTFIPDHEDYYPDAPNPLGRAGRGAEGWLESRAWWVVLGLLAVLTAFSPGTGIVAGSYLIWRIELDPAFTVSAIWLGHVLETGVLWGLGRGLSRSAVVPRPVLDFVGPMHETYWEEKLRTQTGLRLSAFVTRFQPWARRAAALAAGRLGRGRFSTIFVVATGGLLWTLIGVFVGVPTVSFFASAGFALLGWPGVVAALFVTLVLTRTGELMVTWVGRRRLRAFLSRARRFEFWPSTIAYAPLVPWLVFLAGRHRGPLVFSCANPGIDGGGGIVGESKTRILAALAGSGEVVLPAVLVAHGPTARERADHARALVEARPELGGYPVICKPDAAQRGFAVRLVRRPEEFEDCFLQQTRDAILQRYHPGPHECGLLWIREPSPRTDRLGRIFSITRKDFPILVGDGGSTLEELVWAHPRFRCQADVFLQRFAERRLHVLAPGETIRLSQSGNHCQGTLFRDGSDLITPALEDRMDAVARAFRGDGGGELDFGRFDLRYESDEALRAGKGFAMVELNGTTGESTNIYDPHRSIVWAYGVLMRQWAGMYAIGARRRDEGARPMTPYELIRLIRHYYHNRPGSAIAD